MIEESLPDLDHEHLTEDQRWAYEIVVWHLDQTLTGKHPPPLRMILYGEGGTGKSRVIQTITEAFGRRNMKGLLLKGEYTGVAASLIDGKTLHVIGQISINKQPDGMSQDTK
ncbi:MAG: hypothetical protein NXY57DRAFT_906339 [Lentinula lateritia]|nr:MAG: hypothetical protein NXY57DRAFT_906339 [Lentinula lateritia]